MSPYYGRFSCDGTLVSAGKFVGGTLALYGPDGEFHYAYRYEKMYYEGEFDEISDEEFEQFKKEMDERGRKNPMPEADRKSPAGMPLSLSCHEYDQLPLEGDVLSDLLSTFESLQIFRGWVKKLSFHGYKDPEEIRIVVLKNNFYVGLRIRTETGSEERPLILAGEGLSLWSVEQIVKDICGDRKSIEESSVVKNNLKDVTAEVFETQENAEQVPDNIHHQIWTL